MAKSEIRVSEASAPDSDTCFACMHIIKVGQRQYEKHRLPAGPLKGSMPQICWPMDYLNAL